MEHLLYKVLDSTNLLVCYYRLAVKTKTTLVDFHLCNQILYVFQYAVDY